MGAKGHVQVGFTLPTPLCSLAHWLFANINAHHVSFNQSESSQVTTFQNCRIHTYYLTAKCTFESNIWFPTLSLCLVWYWYIFLCSQSRDPTQPIALLLMYIGDESTGNIVYFIHEVHPVFISQSLVAWQQHIWPVRTDWISYICTCVCPFWHQCKVASKPHFPFSSYMQVIIPHQTEAYSSQVCPIVSTLIIVVIEHARLFLLPSEMSESLPT